MSRHRLSVLLCAVLLGATPWGMGGAAERAARTGPFARIAFLRPHDGDTVDFEAGYIRHLDWHRQHADPWVWHGWTIWAGERQRWFVFATFGHSAESLGDPIDPAADEVDNIANVTPHAQYPGSGVYEFLPALSRGDGEPAPLPRLELTTVDLVPGAGERFELVLRANRTQFRDETLWFRLIAGGPVPRYVRLRPRRSLAELINERGDQALPHEVAGILSKVTVEILALRPTMTYGLIPEESPR